MGSRLYPIMFFLSFIIAFSIVFIRYKKAGIPADLSLCGVLLNTLVVLIGGALFTYAVNPQMLENRQIGFSSMGGLFGMLLGALTYSLIFRKAAKKVWEANIIVIPLIYSISKLGCHFAGCCNGREIGEIIFPVQLSETIIFFLIYLACEFYYHKESHEHLIGIVLILSGLGKFSLDFLRESHVGQILSINQILCLVFIALGFMLILWKKGMCIKKI